MKSSIVDPHPSPDAPRSALFPGCSLEASAKGYYSSLLSVLEILGLKLPLLEGWNCCGSSSAHAVDDEAYYTLNLRNLALAEEQGFSTLIAPCAACCQRLAAAQLALNRRRSLRDALNAAHNLHYRGEIRVSGLLEFLAAETSPALLRAKTRSPLSQLTIACYYGCLSLRAPHGTVAPDAQTIMETIVAALGAVPLNWSARTDCCGAGHFITAPASHQRLSASVLNDAAARNADAIIVACPMCHNNLDTRQSSLYKKKEIPRPIPILYLTQLMGLAFGLSPRRLGLNRHFVKIPRSWK